jgi:ribosomal protein L16 Arg81 hydroxylase
MEEMMCLIAQKLADGLATPEDVDREFKKTMAQKADLRQSYVTLLAKYRDTKEELYRANGEIIALKAELAALKAERS